MRQSQFRLKARLFGAIQYAVRWATQHHDMRKKNPSDVIDDFRALVSSSLATWTEMCVQISGNALRKNASVDAFLNAAIGWESFLSDWHIAAINRDSSNFAADLQHRVEESVTSRWPGLSGRIALAIPKHPSLDLVRELLDPQGGNISLGAKDKWRARADRELCDPYRARVLAITDRDHRLIRSVVAVRDCIAHRSQRASDAMNDALSDLAAGDVALRRSVARVQPSGVGAYLFAATPGGRRVEIYHQRLHEIAETFRV